MMTRYCLTIFVCLANCIFAHGHHHAESFESDEETTDSDHDHHHLHLNAEQIENAGIEVSEADSGIIKKTLSLSGRLTVDPTKYAFVITKAGGIVTAIKKQLGEAVVKGEVLAVIDSKEMAEAKAAYLAASRRNKLAQSILEREKILHEKRISAEQEYLQAQSDAEEASIEYELSRQKLYALGFNDQEIQDLLTQPANNLASYELRSPFDGVIEESNLKLGQAVDASTEAFHVVNLNTVLLELGIYPCDLVNLKKGQPVELQHENGTIARSRIERASRTIDADTGCVTAIALINNKSGIWFPGSWVTAQLITEVQKANVVVPKDAVVTIDNQTYVFVKTHDCFEKREVTVGSKDEQNSAIIAGLNPGEHYVSKNAIILKFELSKE